jgi:hypothetical protein
MTEKKTVAEARRDFFIAFILALLLCFTCLARLHTFNEPLERDITTYAVIGHELAHGRALYSDLWDHKPPAIHITYALMELLTGYNAFEIYFLWVFATMATMFGLFAAAKTLSGNAASGLWAAALWALVAADLPLQANQPNTEVFLNATIVWIFVLFLGGLRFMSVRRAVVIGLLCGIASLFKQVALFPAACLMVAFIALPSGRQNRRSRLKPLLVMASVCCAMWGVTCLYFFAAGRWRPFYDAVVVYNRFYAGDMMSNIVAAAAVPFHQTLYVGALLCAGLVIILSLRCAAANDRRPAAALFVSYCLSIFLSIAVMKFIYPHYLQLWLPVLTVGISWIIDLLSESNLRRKTEMAIAFGRCVCFACAAMELPYLFIDPSEISRRKYGDSLFSDVKTMAMRIDALLAPGETFYEYGNETGFYFYTRRRPISGVLYAYPTLLGPLVSSVSARLIDDLGRHPPELLILERQATIQGRAVNPLVPWFFKHYAVAPGTSAEDRFALLFRQGGALQSRLSLGRSDH